MTSETAATSANFLKAGFIKYPLAANMQAKSKIKTPRKSAETGTVR